MLSAGTGNIASCLIHHGAVRRRSRMAERVSPEPNPAGVYGVLAGDQNREGRESGSKAISEESGGFRKEVNWTELDSTSGLLKRLLERRKIGSVWHK